MYRKNVAGQFICVQMLLTATGAVGTGLTPAARRCLDGTFGAGGGTFTEDGTTGSYKYAMSQADSNANNVSIIVTATGCIPVVVNFVTTAADPTDSVRFGLTALPNAAAGANAGLPLSVDASGRVDVLKVNGTSQTARDIGASVLLSSGTGTGQLDFTSGVVKANATQWLGGTIPAVNVTGVPLVDLKYTLGTISPAAAGSVAIDWAQVSNKTSTVALTGTTIATTQKVDIETIKTQAVTCPGGVTVPAATLASTTNITAGTITTVTTVTNQLTAAQIATGVWQDTTAGDFTTAGSIGKSLFTSGVLPGASGGLFVAGTNAATTITTALTATFTGNLTGSIGSLATQAKADVNAEADTALADYDAPTHTELTAELATADDAVLAAIAALNNLSQANIRSAVGLATANLDTQLAAIAAYVDTEVASILTAANAIKLKTDNLPSDPADASDIASAFTTVNSTLSTIAGYIDTEVAAIKLKTDLIPGTQDGHTFAEIVILMAAALLGKASGMAGTSVEFRALDDSKARINATVDTSGNRTVVVLDGT